MKKLVLLLTIFSASLVGCNDDYLERYPLDELSSETFWNTEDDLGAYTSTMYPSMMPSLNGILWGDELSDNMAPRQFNTTAAGLHTASKGTWDWSFLRKCNIFIQNAPSADVSEEVLNEYMGEVLFFRSWYYYDRVMSYGDLPWVGDKVVTTSDDDLLYAPRTPRNEIMDNVVADLQKAAEYLPASRTLGRVNKYAALHMLSRIALSEGTYRKYHNLGGEPDNMFKIAASAALEIINSGKYAIHNTGNPATDYASLHNSQNLRGNKEMILFREYDETLVSQTSYPIRYIEGDNNGLTKDLIEDYLCTDGKPIALSSVYMGDKTIDLETTNRDGRLLQTIVPSGVGFFKGSNLYEEIVPRLAVANGARGSMTSTGYHWRKAYSDEAVMAYGKDGTDVPVFRYAETLLNYAEAKAELGTLTQADVDIAIKPLRDRVGMPNMILSELVRDPQSDMTVAAGYLSSDVPVVLEEVRRERRVELAAENFRRYDLLRWKAGKFYEKPVLGAKWSHFADQTYADGSLIYDADIVGTDIFLNEDGCIDVYHESLPNGRVFDENKHYLYAIPLNEISLNPNLTQNPGW